ncbi:histidine phosphatase family protein [Pleurocapsales cyanobacterium LEGE 10410]|nr:histidine phosphatase family protein [Pleurocapsales cyanobacterium LEGE 10410]
MSQTVWIARHGNRLDFVNPEWFDTADRRYDPPLSEDGFVQAAELAQRLQDEDIAHIFASPFLRTIQTANEIAQVLNLPIKLEAGLGEWHNPEWMTESPETHPRKSLVEKYPLIDWSYNSYLAPQYPETKEDVNRRTAKTAKKIVAQYSENILIVGHGASVHGVTYGLVPDTDYFKVALCCLTKVVRKHDGKWKLDLCADTSHLSQTESEIRLN